VIEFTFKKFFQSQNEIRVLGKNLGHEGSRALKGIKHRKIKKIDQDYAFLQEVFFSLRVKLGFREGIRDAKNLDIRSKLRARELKRQNVIEFSFKKFF
jgi:hypothetical protein